MLPHGPVRGCGIFVRGAAATLLANSVVRFAFLRRVHRKFLQRVGNMAGTQLSRWGRRQVVNRSEQHKPMMRTLFLQAPSYDGFDGGAGSRYQARREIRSFWYPTWLAQPAALVPGSRLIDAPPAGIKLAEVLPLARDYELMVLHTSTPSFASDVKVAAAMKDVNPNLKVGFVGAKV